MNISVNGRSTVPPGFRFHPTEEELLAYYLKKKVASQTIDLNVIRDIDLNKLEPWDIQEKCGIGSAPQNDWYFFSHKDKKYPTGRRTNRATAAGFWKATGRDKVIYSSFRRIGMRKTLVFYKGRAPRGQKSDWIMHEYRLDELCGSESESINCPDMIAENQLAQEEGWVICRVFTKKSHHKLVLNPATSSPLTSDSKPLDSVHSSCDRSLDQVLHYMTAKSNGHNHVGRANTQPPAGDVHPVQGTDAELPVYNSRETGLGDWAVLDRLAAYDADAFPFCPSTSRLLADDGGGGGGEDVGDLWSMTRSATLSGSGRVNHVSHDE